MYERLLACGYPAKLERCVRMIELLCDDRREYV